MKLAGRGKSYVGTSDILEYELGLWKLLIGGLIGYGYSIPARVDQLLVHGPVLMQFRDTVQFLFALKWPLPRVNFKK